MCLNCFNFFTIFIDLNILVNRNNNKHVLSIYLKQNDPREQATFLNFGGNFLIFEQL